MSENYLQEVQKKLCGSTVLVSGATGLIGRTLTELLLQMGAEVTVLVRSREKAERIFGAGREHLSLVIGDVRDADLSGVHARYVIHAASQTSSRAFVQQPVETIRVAVEGTEHLLEYARQEGVDRFVYLSTMEVYGTPQTDEKIDERHGTDLDTMAVRSCYPESKRLCESLAVSYGAEYGVPVGVIRLTQTFGPGVRYDDGRVFAEFARCALEGRDIVLKTKGETRRSYLYTEDAARAILAVMTLGEAGEAYNAANEATYCSIYEMAQLVAERIAGGKICVRIEEDERNSRGFAPTLHMNLDTAKLRALGWAPTCSLQEMFTRMIADMRPEEK